MDQVNRLSQLRVNPGSNKQLAAPFGQSEGLPGVLSGAALGLISLLTVGLFSVSALAQGSPSRKSPAPVAQEPSPIFSEVPPAASPDRFNAVVNPFALLVGRAAVGLDFALTPQITVGPRLQYWNLSLSATTDFEEFKIREIGLGARANYHPGQALQTGFYAGGALGYTARAVDTRGKGSGQTITGDGAGMYLEALGGYQWFWEQFNVAAGAGFQLPLGSSKIKITDGSKTEEVALISSGLTLEFNIGFAF
jgi:hypothetical protein